MKRNLRTLLTLLLLAGLLAALPLSAQLTITYKVRDLGVPSGWVESHATSVNWLSQVGGFLMDSETGSSGLPNCHAFLWNAITGIKDIGAIGHGCAIARQVDFFGRVAGQLQFVVTPPPPSPSLPGLRTFYYSPTNSPKMSDIGALFGNLPTSSAVFQDMNNRAEIVGFSHTADDSASRAFFWSRQTQIQDLGSLAGPVVGRSVAHSINDGGRIVGHSYLTSAPGEVGVHHAIYMPSPTPGTMVDLAAKFGIPGNSWAFQINNRNQISGEYKQTGLDGLENVVFFIPDPAGHTIFKTGNLGPYNSTVWRKMNESGQVIGIVDPDPPYGPFQSFRWTPGRPPAILEPYSGDTNSQPIGMNNRGQVVGNSFTPGVSTDPVHAVLWNANRTAAKLLPALGAGGSCTAVAINDFGVITGICWPANEVAPRHAVIWTPSLSFN